MLKLCEISFGSQGRICAVMHPTPKQLSAGLQTAVRVTAIIDLIIGLMFLFAPELGFTLWPTPIAPVLSRFIGSIIVANGVGAWLVVRQGTWEGARVLFAVALVYGVVVLVALLYHLLLVGDRALFFWIYAVVDAIFLGPIAYIYWKYERS
jgi:hypothetical protein